jgi:tripeptidyl-peptidase-1
MEVRDLIFLSTNIAVTDFSSAVVQTTSQTFGNNSESSLDLQYGMALTNPQPVTLLQVGDLVEGWFSLNHIIAVNLLQYCTGGGFNNWLDAVDASFCGGDSPTLVSGQLFSSFASPHSREFLFQDGIYPDTKPGGFDGKALPRKRVSM